ncbi:hypothetical protein MNBD_GAMMA05-330 [hydrothermal vent metagenome]|uniref:Translocation protein TolB n=1 Tax=hydrothermal vent metagenome TaxID=652676 RepID=A0A3B0WRY5_9ZZZZ
MVDQAKRLFLKQGLSGLSVCGVGAIWSGALLGGVQDQKLQLLPADENGLRLLPGLQSRVLARSGESVKGGQHYEWHNSPDGGACFAADDGGWIYVSNSEVLFLGGVGAIVFAADGKIVDAYSILKHTSRNCSGGATPWGSWLSCEEVNAGRVWECDPAGQKEAVVRPALGVFNHEAVAVDELSQCLYLTEDKKDGCLYRFIADQQQKNGFPDLSSGRLEVATMTKNNAGSGEGVLSWQSIPDPSAKRLETRYQVPEAKKFNGGEGIAYFDGRIIFTTKGDNRVWSYDTYAKEIDILYDIKDTLTPILSGVDNVTVSQQGDIYVAEDGGDLQIVVIADNGVIFPVAQLEGHDDSEIAGLAFSPDGKRLYFSSQRGTNGSPEGGITYEIRGF